MAHYNLDGAAIAELAPELSLADGSPVLDGSVTCSFITSVQQLAEVIASIQGDVIVIYDNNEIDPAIPSVSCNFPIGILNTQVQILIGRGQLDMGDISCEYLVLVKGNITIVSAVASELNKLEVGKYYFPDYYWEEINDNLNKTPVEDKARVTLDVSVYGDSDDMLKLLQTEGIPWYIKTISMLHFLFPWTIKEKAPEVVRMSLPELSTAFNIRGVQKIPPSSQERSDLFIIYSAIYCLCPSWSRVAKLAAQVHRRIVAAMTQFGPVTISVSDVERVLNKVQWKDQMANSRVDQTLGHVLAINSRFKFQLQTKRENLADIDSLMHRYHLSRWTGGLLEQMRMVYTSFRGVTARFAVAVMEVARAFVTGLGRDFQRDFDALHSIASHFQDYPYLSCSFSVPVQYRIASFPRLCYLGVLYYKDNLTTKLEKDEFEHYNIAGVAEAVQSPGDRKIIEKLAQIIPSENLSLIAQIMAICALEQSEMLVHSLKPPEVEIIYTILGTKDAPGIWYTTESRRRRDSARAKYVGEVVTVINNIIAQHVSEHSTKMMYIQDPDERILLMNQFTSWRAAVARAVKQIHTLDTVLSAASTTTEREKRAEVMAELADCYRMAQAGPEDV